MPLALFRRAIAERGLGLTDRALADFDKAIGLDPNNHMAYLGRGALLARARATTAAPSATSIARSSSSRATSPP